MPTIEKLGGYWFDDIDSGYVAIFEDYDARTDLIAAVHFKPPDFYRAAIFEKVANPGCKLPFWDERRPDAIFSDKAEAIAHALKLLAIACQTHRRPESN